MLDPAFFMAFVSSRICHDLVSPISTVSHSLELLDDEAMDEGTRDMAKGLLRDSAKKLEAYILFLRYAFGSMGMSDSIADIHAAKKIIDDYAAQHHPSLEWDINTEHFSYFHTRMLMQMAHIGISSLPRGGVVTIRVSDNNGLPSIVVEAKGERAMLRAETEAAIEGSVPDGGWNARNVHMVFAVEVAEKLGTKLTATRTGPNTVIYVAQNMQLEANISREGIS